MASLCSTADESAKKSSIAKQTSSNLDVVVKKSDRILRTANLISLNQKDESGSQTLIKAIVKWPYKRNTHWETFERTGIECFKL